MAFNIHFYVVSAEQLHELLKKSLTPANRIYIENSVALNNLDLLSQYRDITFYLCSPQILRHKDIRPFNDALKSGIFKGVLIRNLETYSYINANIEDFKGIDLVLDSNMYVLNKDALAFYLDNSKFSIAEYYVSFELNDKEERTLIESLNNNNGANIIHSAVIYGRIPMMVSANCVRKTLGGECRKMSGFETITDRKNMNFPVLNNCDFCYNVIYNSVPLSLHRFYDELIRRGNIRVDFTNEDSKEVNDISSYFLNLENGYKEPPYNEYTTGHFKRGVE